MRFILVAASLALSVSAQALSLTIATDTPASETPATFGPAFGWEMWNMLSMIGSLNDSRFINAAKPLAGSVIRVGGITADWVRYVEGAPTVSDTDGDYTTPMLKGFWPNAPNNLTTGDFQALLSFFNATGLRLLFDLNELYGRNCSTTNPTTKQPDWCVGAWDTTNVRWFLQWLHDNDLVGGSSPLFGFELGNELVTHLDADSNIADVITLAGIIRDVWSDVPASQVPPLYAPSTDACSTNDTYKIMLGVEGAVKGFTYHAYPGQSGAGQYNLTQILLNSTWLRTGIMTGSDSYQCLDYWNSGPRSTGMDLWITESSSSWNWTVAQPAQNSFLHGFFTLPELGQYAQTGVGVVARWSFCEESDFGTIRPNGSRWDVSADYFLLLAFKQTVGTTVLNVSGDASSDVLAYAHCTAGTRNGSVTLYAVNPSTQPVPLVLTTSDGNGIAASPRLQWVFTGPGGPDDLGSFTPALNGNTAAPLRIGEDGTVPPMPPAYVPAGGAGITMPPRSQGFYVLTNAGAAACR